jgi:hypothetical protein
MGVVIAELLHTGVLFLIRPFPEALVS